MDKYIFLSGSSAGNAQIEVMRVVLTIGYRAGFLYPGRRERARTAALDELARKRGGAGFRTEKFEAAGAPAANN